MQLHPDVYFQRYGTYTFLRMWERERTSCTMTRPLLF